MEVLLHQLKWADGKEDVILRTAEQAGQEDSLPEALKNPPTPAPGLELFLEAYKDLSTSRREGWIPWDVIEEYADRLGLDDLDRWRLHFIVKSMDLEYMKHVKRKNDSGTSNTARSGGGISSGSGSASGSRGRGMRSG